MQPSSSNRKLYGMLKGRWGSLYKNTECKSNNLEYVIMSCILLHKICTRFGDPYESRRRLQVQKLELFARSRQRNENHNIALSMNRLKTTNWPWEQQQKTFFRKCLVTVKRTHFYVMFLYGTCIIRSKHRCKPRRGISQNKSFTTMVKSLKNTCRPAAT